MMAQQDVRFATRAGDETVTLGFIIGYSAMVPRKGDVVGLIEMEGQRANRVRRRVEDVIFICDDCLVTGNCHVTIDVMLGEPEENV